MTPYEEFELKWKAWLVKICKEKRTLNTEESATEAYQLFIEPKINTSYPPSLIDIERLYCRADAIDTSLVLLHTSALNAKTNFDGRAEQYERTINDCALASMALYKAIEELLKTRLLFDRFDSNMKQAEGGVPG